FAECGKLWTESLERNRDTLNLQIKPAEETVNRLRQELSQAQRDLRGVETSTSSDPSLRRLGEEANAPRVRLQVSTLREGSTQAEAKLQYLRQQLLDCETRIAQVKTMTATSSAMIGSGDTPKTVAKVVTAAPPPVVPPPEPEQNTDILVTVANF